MYTYQANKFHRMTNIEFYKKKVLCFKNYLRCWTLWAQGNWKCGYLVNVVENKTKSIESQRFEVNGIDWAEVQEKQFLIIKSWTIKLQLLFVHSQLLNDNKKNLFIALLCLKHTMFRIIDVWFLLRSAMIKGIITTADRKGCYNI